SRPGRGGGAPLPPRLAVVAVRADERVPDLGHRRVVVRGGQRGALEVPQRQAPARQVAADAEAQAPLEHLGAGPVGVGQHDGEPVLRLVGDVDEVVDDAAGHELVAELAQQRDLPPVRELGQRAVRHLDQDQRELLAGPPAPGPLGAQPVAQEARGPQAGLGVDRRQVRGPAAPVAGGRGVGVGPGPGAVRRRPRVAGRGPVGGGVVPDRPRTGRGRGPAAGVRRAPAARRPTGRGGGRPVGRAAALGAVALGAGPAALLAGRLLVRRPRARRRTGGVLVPPPRLAVGLLLLLRCPRARLPAGPLLLLGPPPRLAVRLLLLRRPAVVLPVGGLLLRRRPRARPAVRRRAPGRPRVGRGAARPLVGVLVTAPPGAGRPRRALGRPGRRPV